MARKNENILEVLIQLPWWVSVLFSGVAYVGLKWILPGMVSGNMFAEGIAKGLSPMAHFFALVLFIPAPISFFNAWRKRQLLEKQKGIETIRSLNWKKFEELVAEAYRRQGYAVIENPGGGADGGIDVRLKKNGHLHLVQCKQWRSQKVGVKVVREMYGVMVAEHAASAIVITSGTYTQEARNFASGKPLDLVDGAQLEALISQVQVSKEKRSISSVPIDKPVQVAEPETVDPPDPDPTRWQPVQEVRTCPRCGNELVLRTAKKGPNAGAQFYGCASFPKCRHTEQMKAAS